jgi:hypothetical protein
VQGVLYIAHLLFLLLLPGHLGWSSRAALAAEAAAGQQAEQEAGRTSNGQEEVQTT